MLLASRVSAALAIGAAILGARTTGLIASLAACKNGLTRRTARSEMIKDVADGAVETMTRRLFGLLHCLR